MNNCVVTEFYMTPFSTTRRNEILISTGFLFMYLLAVLGNLIIIAVVCGVPQLHTPMYFFLCNLSSVDVIFVSAFLPKMLSITLTGYKTISFYGCITQLYFFLFCANAENNILTCMAYDRYVAVCSPLRYSLIMTRKVCTIIASSFMTFSVINSLMLSLLISTLSFCYSHQIDHFFCEIKPLMVLSNSDIKNIKTILSMENICGSVSFMLILTSYIRIFSTVSKIRSSKEKLKAFSSCSSHIITVLLFYGPVIFMYFKPESQHSNEQDKIFSIFYVAVVPMLNPFVYSLRNKDVLGGAKRIAKIIWNRIFYFNK